MPSIHTKANSQSAVSYAISLFYLTEPCFIFSVQHCEHVNNNNFIFRQRLHLKNAARVCFHRADAREL